MALVYGDRVIETSVSTGTGPISLVAAVTGYQRFSSICSLNDAVYYAIFAIDGSGNPSGDWETGRGIYSSENTLSRTTIADSSNSGSAVDFAAGTKWVMASPGASLFDELPRHILVADQAAYDALTPDSNTVYHIPE